MPRGGARRGAGRPRLSDEQRWLRGGAWHPRDGLKVVGLDGVPVPRPLPHPAPEPEEPPPHLETKGRRFFREVNEGWVLDVGRRQLSELMADTVDEIEKCRESVRHFGLLVKTANGPKLHPLVSVLHAARRDFVAMLQVLDLADEGDNQ